MKILVLGSAGFIGSNICKRLSENNFEFQGVDNFSFSKKAAHIDFTINSCISDLSEKFLNTFDIIISSYCSNIIFSIDHIHETYINNTVNAIKCFSKFKGKIIYLSTSSIYGNATLLPTPEEYSVNVRNAYDTSKLITELYLQERGNYTTLRLSNVYGPYQRPLNPYCGIIGKFICNNLVENVSIIYGNGEDTRDYTYVDDVINAIMKCIELPALNTEINIGTNIETSILDLCNLIGIRYELYRLTSPRKIDGIAHRCLDITKAKNLLDWEPQITLKEGLKLTEEWIKKEYNL